MVESGDGEGRSEMAYPNDAPTITGSRLGVIIGSSLSADELLAANLTATRREIDTAWGSAGVLDVDDFVLLRRHGLDTFTPAHRVNHRANLAALCAAGCD